MGLRYNEETAVIRDPVSMYDQETSFLNENMISRDVDLQNTSYVLTGSGIADTTTTLNFDVVITTLNFSASAENTINTSILNSYVYINGTLIDLLTLQWGNGISMETASGQKSVSIPNWKLKKGDTIRLLSTSTNSMNEVILISVIGYKI